MPETKEINSLSMGLSQANALYVVGHAALEPGALLDTVLKFILTTAKIFTYPLRLFLRPWHGTLDVHPVQQILALPLLNSIMVLSFVTTYYYSGPKGLIGVPLFGCFTWLAYLYHCRRHFRAIVDMSREKDAQDQGPSILSLFGYQGTIGKLAILYEPAVVLSIGMIGFITHLFHPYLMIYLTLLGGMWCLQGLTEFYLSWLYLRRQLDKKNQAEIIHQLLSGKLDGIANTILNTSALLALPVSASPERAAQLYAASKGLDTEFAKMMTERKEATA